MKKMPNIMWEKVWGNSRENVGKESLRTILSKLDMQKSLGKTTIDCEKKLLR